jgi:DNA repair exonuclease SbcCD ATPase subunit
LLSIALLGSFFYIYKLSDRSKTAIVALRHKNALFAEEKNQILKDLHKSQLVLEEALENKTSLSKELNDEKEKIKSLIAKLESSKIDKNTLITFKKGVDDADDRILNLLGQIKEYKSKIDSTTIVLKYERNAKDTLLTANKKLNSKLNDASTLSYYNLQTNTFKVKSSGKEVETTSASRVDLIKVSFYIGENKLAKADQKSFYAQIIDANNSVLGDKKTEYVAGKSLTYSSAKKIKYTTKSALVEFEVPVDNLSDGKYYINIFDKSNPILNTTFVLN